MEQINKLQKEIDELRKILQEKENEMYRIKKEWATRSIAPQVRGGGQENNKCSSFCGDVLPKWAIERYSRQILLPDIGVSGQQKLCAARVLIVGAGGLGCPAALYLAGAGVGELGIVDYDSVEVTNIHRQVLHTEADQMLSKAESAANTLRSINSRIKVTAFTTQLDSSNALSILNKYDLVLDCTDNLPTRYLLSDAAVMTQIPLISGSALKMEGQLTVYGYRGPKTSDDKGDVSPAYSGSCYRCIFPTPAPADTVQSCSSAGVAGPVTGVIGALQALEAIKYLSGHHHSKLLVDRMLLFDGEDCTFRTVRLRSRNPNCPVCSSDPSITALTDYEMFCNAQAKEKKKQDSRLKSERRKQEKEKRMNGQSYYGFRITTPNGDKKKWVQDVPKSERKIGPPCKSEFCAKGASRQCTNITEEKRKEIFFYFWNELDWKGKKKYVRSLVDTVPPKRRRLKHKGEVSRKGDSKVYHLILNENRVPVCRVMFLNTLGVKEAMVRCWLVNEEKPKATKTPIKALNVHSYIQNLPKSLPKCQYCISSGVEYISLDNIKNLYQLYNLYVKDMKLKGVSPASRKTFSKVISSQNIRIFKPKNETDVCDLVSQHNLLPSISYQGVEKVNEIGYYYEQW